MKKMIGTVLIIIAIGIVITVLYQNSRYSTTTRTFSSNALLNSSWENYKKNFINSDGRVIDYSQNSITTSEGQSYAMLQAVWVDDKKTFDSVWTWTKNTLKRPNDSLFGWRWGKQKNGNYGFMDNGGDNAAADADTDIALALIFASHRWGDQKYLSEAQNILPDLWNKETDIIDQKRYVVAGNWAIASDRDIINPSYFAPYAWRIFSSLDSKHNWNSLIDPAYQLLSLATNDKLDRERSAQLPPDWIAIDKKSGELSATNIQNFTTNYSYDALRIPWRIALDYYWFQSPQASSYLKSNFNPLAQTYAARGSLAGAYTHDGKAVAEYENPALYATAVAYFLVTNPPMADRIYNEKIIKLYSNATNSFNNKLTYYEQNWLWFGIALYNKQLVPFIK